MCLSFHGCRILLSITSSRFIHVVARVRISFHGERTYIHTTFDPSLVSGQVGHSCLLASMDYAAVNIVVLISLQDPAFNSFSVYSEVGYVVALSLLF